MWPMWFRIQVNANIFFSLLLLQCDFNINLKPGADYMYIYGEMKHEPYWTTYLRYMLLYLVIHVIKVNTNVGCGNF